MATWENVDPNCQRCSIFVAGLSNAWAVTEPIPPDTNPTIRRKTLQLKFKRVKDKWEFVSSQWVYRASKVQLRQAERIQEKEESPKADEALVENRKVRLAILKTLEPQLDTLQQEEIKRQINLELVALELEALRKATEERKPTGIEADQAKERLQRLELQKQTLMTQDRERQIFFQLLSKRVQALRRELDRGTVQLILADNLLLVSLGEDCGLMKGEMLTIRRTEEVGMAQVETVGTHHSLARMVSANERPSVGDQVTRIKDRGRRP
jgi:hypothetical protein